jgi:hypothetical protein
MTDASRPAQPTIVGPGGPHAAQPQTAAAHGDPTELHRLCTFELDLTGHVGHCVTVSLNGWYPVSVSCCDRLGGAWYDGTYYPFDSPVDYVRCLEERYEPRPPGAEREPLQVLDRRARTDNPVIPIHSWQQGSAGRFPGRVGGPIPDPATARPS